MTVGLNSELWLLPNWQAPAHIRAGTSWRRGGISQGPYASLNLALHVGDEADAVIPLVEKGMREALPLKVPVVVETGTGENWLEAH